MRGFEFSAENLRRIDGELRAMWRRGEVDSREASKIFDYIITRREIPKGYELSMDIRGLVSLKKDNRRIKKGATAVAAGDNYAFGIDPSLRELFVTYVNSGAGIIPWNVDGMPKLREKTEEEKMVENMNNALRSAQDIVQKQNDLLENIRKDPLICHTVLSISKDKKYTYYTQADKEVRIHAVEGLELGHQVLLHPKTLQIVENIGFPPLEASPYSPGKIPDVTWDDIGGLEEAKRDMIEAIEMPFKQKVLFAHYNKRPIKGILLSGEPGCGKTMLAKAAANSLAKLHKAESVRTGFLYIKGPEILNKYVGATEQIIREIFIDASRHNKEHGYPAIIFIDEADAILSVRGQNFMGNTIVPAFLTEMDGMEESNCVVILATNRPDVLDPAIVREGRIDRKIHIHRPSKHDAIGIIKRNMSKFPISIDYSMDVLAEGMAYEFYDSDRMVDNHTNFSSVINGAMLATAVDQAVSYAIHRDISQNVKERKDVTGLTPNDILMAVDRIYQQNRGIKHNLMVA